MGQGGRPDRYLEHVKPYLGRVKRMKGLGYTDKQIAESLNIGASTLIEYKKKFPEFAEVLKEGALDLMLDIQEGLANKAKPHTLTEVTQMVEPGSPGKPDKITGKITKVKECEPDNGAAALMMNGLYRYTCLSNLKDEQRERELILREKEFEMKKKVLEKLGKLTNDSPELQGTIKSIYELMTSNTINRTIGSEENNEKDGE